MSPPPCTSSLALSLRWVNWFFFFFLNVLLHVHIWMALPCSNWGWRISPYVYRNQIRGISDNLCKFVYFQQSCEKTNVGIIKKTYKKYPNGLTYKWPKICSFKKFFLWRLHHWQSDPCDGVLKIIINSSYIFKRVESHNKKKFVFNLEAVM